MKSLQEQVRCNTLLQMNWCSMCQNGYLDGTFWNIGDILPQSKAPSAKIALPQQFLPICATLVYLTQITYACIK